MAVLALQDARIPVEVRIRVRLRGLEGNERLAGYPRANPYSDGRACKRGGSAG